MAEKSQLKPRLTLDERRIVFRFTEDTLEYPRQDFDKVAMRLLPEGFPESEHQGYLIERCRKAYRIGPA